MTIVSTLPFEDRSSQFNELKCIPSISALLVSIAKHPNQYTYRGKAAGPTGRGRGSPTKRGAGESGGRRRDAALDGSWGLPDHLSHLSDILPSPTPSPIIAPNLDPNEPPIPPQIAQVYPFIALPPPGTHYEFATKVKFPTKRTTLPDMRKRAESIFKYLSQVQVEMSERDKQNRNLGFPPRLPPPNLTPPSAKSKSGSGSPAGPTSVASSAALKMMDDLSRDLTHFQDRFL